MAEAYIVEAVRTAGGRRNGALSGWHPADLGGEVLNAIIDRSGIDPAAVEDVIVGCVSQAGEQSWHIAAERARGYLGPAVRQQSAGDPFRGAGRDVRHAGHGDRGRRGKHVARADGLAGNACGASGAGCRAL